MKRLKMFLVAASLVLYGCTERGNRYDAEGFFESEEITVSAEESGRIINFAVREGESVSRGQLIAGIDSTQLYLSKLQLQKNVKSVVSNRPDISRQLAVLEEQIASVEKDRDRFSRLLADGASTVKQLDDIDARLAVLYAQVEAQKSALSGTTASINAQSSAIDIQIAQLDNRLSKCSIKAPADGTVLTKYMNEGEFVAAGRPLVKLADLKHVYLRAYVTSAQLSALKLGQNLNVYVDFGGDNVREYAGTLEWISSRSEFTPKNIQTSDERENLVYAVKVAVENDGFIKLGMYGGIRY